MNTRKLLIFMMLVTMASLSWGIDLGLCATTGDGQGQAVKKRVELRKKSPSPVRRVTPPQIGEVPPPPGANLSWRNQAMLEVAEWAKIRRENMGR
jgi:hypothetical protein